ncbi:MAG: HAMP domain-containing sensor histidine kinase [Magnetospirillum sp.]|nr:HAMP domain-containing sensor histidine kinase [Magnetospirillum sp.]
MTSDPLPPRSQSVPAAPIRLAAPGWRTLWIKVVVALAGFAGLTTATLFFSVDHFVKSRFVVVHDVRLARLTNVTQRTVADQLAQMGSIARLLANDSELVDDTYYHLYGGGGREQPRAAADRISNAFRLDSVSFWTKENRLVGAVGPPMPPVSFPNDGKGVHTAAIRRGDDIWLIAVAALRRQEGTFARLQLAKPLTTLFRPESDTGVVVSVARSKLPPAGAIRVPVIAGGDPSAAMDIIAPDEVGFALADVKTVLALVMTVFWVLLVASIAVLLRRLFHPVFNVIDAALAVGRGEFGRTVSGGGSEMRPLVDAFNRMSDDLKRLRRLEREAQHREQLSAIGRVAARVAHDLNNPLTVISNVAHLVAAREDIDSQLRADMQLVLHHCKRSIATIEALLAYGRPIRLKPQEIDLGALCEGIARRWAGRYADVRLTFSGAPLPLPVSADPYRVEQMLDNLLDNARSFGGKVEVAVGRKDERAFVRVADDGPGFSAEAHEHLFEPFFTTRTGGTGLGLASCLAIARAHGGDLDVDAGPPAALTVWLPLASPSPRAGG